MIGAQSRALAEIVAIKCGENVPKTPYFGQLARQSLMAAISLP
jgi:hypothetical protein